METEYLKTLWMLRFEKIRQGEGRAAWTYQEILDECLADYGKNDEKVVFLSQLVSEERAHEKLAEELMRICRRNHPEANALNLDDYEVKPKLKLNKNPN